MKSAKQLLQEYNDFSFRDPQAAAEMFTDDDAFEMPYFESLGVPGRYQGHDQIRGFFAFVRELFPDLQLVNTTVVCESADGKVVVAEYEFTSRSTKTGSADPSAHLRTAGSRERQDQATAGDHQFRRSRWRHP